MCLCADTRARVESFSFLRALSFHRVLLCPLPIMPYQTWHCRRVSEHWLFVWVLEADLLQACMVSSLSIEPAPQFQQCISFSSLIVAIEGSIKPFLFWWSGPPDFYLPVRMTKIAPATLIHIIVIDSILGTMNQNTWFDTVLCWASLLHHLKPGKCLPRDGCFWFLMNNFCF